MVSFIHNLPESLNYVFLHAKKALLILLFDHRDSGLMVSYVRNWNS